ncbi:hypothetical protein ACILG0_15730 [Pseudomonadota bacterium AL_CKDN230030165-1A_HGKHYDSX7]
MEWHLYRTAPIDVGWDFLLTLAEAFALLETAEAREEPLGMDHDLLRAQFNEVQERAEQLGWEGDFRTEPHVLMLPDPAQSRLAPGFVWKQDNGGLCFVASPIALPWLDQPA